MFILDGAIVELTVYDWRNKYWIWEYREILGEKT